MKAKTEMREQARELRQQGVSVPNIAKQLNVAKSSVSSWVRDIPLTNEQQNHFKENRQQAGLASLKKSNVIEINREQGKSQRSIYQQQGREYARKGRELHQIGCTLYWAEGAKLRNGINFTNSDEDMLLLFLRFLREELRVPDELIVLTIHCHSKDEVEHARIQNYWTEKFNLPSSSLRKTITHDGGNVRQNRLENGICTIQVYRTEYVQHIYGAIQEYGGFTNDKWLFMEI